MVVRVNLGRMYGKNVSGGRKELARNEESYVRREWRRRRMAKKVGDGEMRE